MVSERLLLDLAVIGFDERFNWVRGGRDDFSTVEKVCRLLVECAIRCNNSVWKGVEDDLDEFETERLHAVSVVA